MKSSDIRNANCFDDETLGRYAYRLTDEPATSQVRAHLGECARCRVIVEQRQRLGAALDGWLPVDPSVGFDARVRQAVEAEQARREGWGLWGLGWARGLAAISAAVLIVAGTVWFTHRHHRDAHPAELARRQSGMATGLQASAPSVKVKNPNVVAHADAQRAKVTPEAAAAGEIANDDQDGLAMEDYDVAANFDLLSDMPKSDSHGGD